MPRIRHPRGLYVLFFTEMWERFSYYGMRALLMYYMVDALRLDVSHASKLFGLYMASVYLTPLLGGFVADRLLGPQRAVMWGASLMALGHFAMVLSPLPCFYAALIFLALGCGLFKPSLSVLVGELYHDDDPRRDNAFGLFYMGINVGAFLAPLICGTLGQTYGWHYGFGSAGVGMLLGLAIFSRGRKYVVPASLAAMPAAMPAFEGSAPAAPIMPETAPIAPYAAGGVERETASCRVLPLEAAAVVREAPSRTVIVQRVVVLAALALFGNVLFWSAYEQAGSSVALFVDRYCELHLFGGEWAMHSTWFQAANPMFIILLTPLLAILWGALHTWQKEPSTPMKFVLGLAFVSAGFCTMRYAGGLVDAGDRVQLSWLLAASFINTLGELCISPVGLSAVTKLSPPRYASQMMGAWLASIGCANYGSGVLASYFDQVPHAIFFAIPMTLTGLGALFLWMLSPTLRRMMHGVH